MKFVVSLFLLLSFILPLSSVAQVTSRVNQIELSDVGDHGIILKLPTSGWPSTGMFEWTLPIPPSSVSSGFVEAGSSTLTSLQWDNTNKYWKAVTGSAGLTGAGNTNLLTKWASGSTLTNSLVSDDGSTVSITNGALLLSGATGSTPASGAGERMMWIPAKRAIRAGEVNATQWDDEFIGLYTTGLGFNTIASGEASSSIGHNTSAIGDASVAMGGSSVAIGHYSVAIGYSAEAHSNYSTAIGYGPTASKIYATAIGYLTEANGDASTALGAGSKAKGDYSTATGYVTTASGTAATAMGHTTTASGDVSVAAGSLSTASGLYSVAMGEGTTASGRSAVALGHLVLSTNDYSTAMGGMTVASGAASTALGFQTLASGTVSTAMGRGTVASGTYSTAMGHQTSALGDFSTAMGNYVSSDIHTGSFIFGDASTATLLENTAANQFMVRAAGGTIFYSNTAANVGVKLDPNQNAWATVSDSNRKENRLNIDGENVLAKLSNIWLGSWNYKGQDPSQYRHYGPMAQEFFAAFGNDGVGAIGNDTSLSTADVDGVTLIAVQALNTRDKAMNEEITSLRERVEMLEEIVRKMASHSNDPQIIRALQK